MVPNWVAPFGCIVPLDSLCVLPYSHNMHPGHSYLYTGSVFPQTDYEMVAPIDRLFFAAADLDVKAARAVVATSVQQPFGAQRLLVITTADQLSEAVQNTLLKLLEEPPLFLTIVLVTTRPEGLLPTVRSRLHKLSAADVVTPQSVTNIALPSIEELKSTIGQPKDRAGLVATLETIRQAAWRNLLDSPSTSLIQAHDILERSIRRLGQNANPKLVVDALLLNWPL